MGCFSLIQVSLVILAMFCCGNCFVEVFVNLMMQYQTQKRIPYGSEPLPRGIVQETSNLEMRPLWGVSKVPVSWL